MHHRPLDAGQSISGDSLPSFLPSYPTLSLWVPARPEALGIVRLVLMSCGATAGVDIEKIFDRSQEVAEAFADALLATPDATKIVVRTTTTAADVELSAFSADAEA